VNVTSIKKHRDELLAKFNDFDILSINETNLRPDNNFYLRGYNIYRNDRADKKGGEVMLAVKENFKCREILNKTINDNEDLAVEIETEKNKSILVASVYVPLRTHIQSDLFGEIHHLNSNCLIMGDLNATLQQMGSRKTNFQGWQLKDLLDEGYLQCIENDITTYERDDYEEKIDWIVASQTLHSFIMNVLSYPTLGIGSGHKPITFELPMQVNCKPASPRMTHDFKKANWSKYRQALDNQLSQ
jgi:Endonuclease-reverse transcriptase